MKIAIVGLGPESHDDAPWHDPGWSLWGLPWDAYAPRCDLLFEMHSAEFLEKARRCGPEYVDRLIECDTPVYMQAPHPGVPASMAYPLAEVVAVVGDYFGSSPAYMLALAIVSGATEIGLWGINLSASIYDHHRPNLEYLIGFARGRGITVAVHGPSALLTYRQEQTGHPSLGTYAPHYPARYGYTQE